MSINPNTNYYYTSTTTPSGYQQYEQTTIPEGQTYQNYQPIQTQPTRRYLLQHND